MAGADALRARARRRLRTAACASSARPASDAASTRRRRSSDAIRSTDATADRRSPTRSRRARVEPDARRRTSTTRRTARPAATHAASIASTASAPLDDVIAEMERFEPARPGRRRISRRPQVEDRARRAAPRLMAVNIDEGEPGTFKDRYYLERDPHRFLEGMLIAAWAVGIDDDLHLSARRIRGVPRDPRARDRGARGRSAVPVAARSTCAAARAPTSAAKSRR